MIGKIPKPGKSFGGCIEYNILKKSAAVLYADGVRTDKVAHTITDFNMQRKLNPGLGQAVGHISLSWSPKAKDRLNDEKMVIIAKEYLQKMKIKNTQLLIVKHRDRPHPHVHIVYNRVDNEGKTIPDSFQRLNNIKISKELTLKYGMYMGQGKEKVNRQQLKGIDKLKYELYDTIKSVSQKVTSMAELKRELLKRDIGMQYKYKSGTLEKQGISFSKGDYKFKGSEIDRSLSYGRLSKQIEQQAEHKLAEEQRPTLAQQLREAIGKEPVKEQSGHRSVIDLFGHIPTITPEPEPYRRKKRKGHDNEQDQSLGISR